MCSFNNGQVCNVQCVQIAVCEMFSVHNGLQHRLQLQYAAYSLRGTMRNVQGTRYIIQCTIYSELVISVCSPPSPLHTDAWCPSVTIPLYRNTGSV